MLDVDEAGGEDYPMGLAGDVSSRGPKLGPLDLQSRDCADLWFASVKCQHEAQEASKRSNTGSRGYTYIRGIIGRARC